MSKYFGDIAEDETIKLPWNTFNSDGASITVTAVSTDIDVFKDGVILTDPDAGGTVTLNVGTGNGSHFVTINTSADAEYTTGSDYGVKLKGITVDGQTINAFVGDFSIQNRYDKVDLVKILGTALTETPGQLAAAFKKLFNVAVPVLVASDVMRGTDGANTTVPDAAGVVPTAVENRQEMDANSTRLDADISSRAEEGEYDTQLDANMSSRAPASEYDTEMARITANVATEAKQDAGDAVRDRISDIQEADKIIDFPGGTLTYKEKGTANVLLTKDLKDPDDAAVNSTEDVIAAEENV